MKSQTLDELYRQGDAARSAGEYVQAEAIWRQALLIDPADPITHRDLGIALYGQKRYEEAEASFRESLRLDPDYLFAHGNLGSVLYDQGHYEKAEDSFREVLRLDPDDAVAKTRLGNTLRNQGRYEEAEATYQEALNLAPRNSWVFDNVIDFYQVQGLLAEANALHLIKGKNLDELYRHGAAARAVGNYVQAEIIWRQALRLNPGDHITYRDLGISLHGQGRDEEAEAAYRESLRLKPDYAFAHSNLGNVLYDQGRFDESESAYREALRLDPSAYDYARLGRLLGKKGLYEEAEAAYQESLRLGPNDPWVYNHFGYLYQLQDRLLEAVNFYQKALIIAPNYTTAENNLSEAERLISLRNTPSTRRSEERIWQPQNDPLQDVLRSVVRVVTPTDSGIKYGTGWVVKREGNRIWVLTNRHVVAQTQSDFDELRTQSQANILSDEIQVDLFSTPPEGRTFLRVDAKILESTPSSDELDLALLVVDDAPEDIQPLVIASNVARLNTDVRIIGHHNDPWSLARGYVNSPSQGNTMQLAETAIGKRSSGSPILNESNQVVGIITSIEPPNIGRGNDVLGGFSYGHPSSVLLEILTRWNVL